MSKVIFREKSRAQERRELRNQKKLQQKKESRNYHERIQKHLDQRDVKKYSIEDLDEFSELQQTKSDVWELQNVVQDELKEVQDLLHDLNPQLQDKEPTNLSNFRHYLDHARFSKYWNVEWDGWKLPAQSKAYDICDKWLDFGCNNVSYHPQNQHYSEHQQYKCKRSSCILCVESWINRQAARTTRRLSKYGTMQPYKFRHIILSPPPNEVNGVHYDYEKLKKYLDFALKVANIKTASIVFHPFRFYDSKKTKPYYSPHFHILTTDFVTNTTEFYNKTKWVIDNKGKLETEIDIFNSIRYQLSHAGTKAHHHAVRYTGAISYRKLKIEKEPKIHVCPYCQLELLLFRLNPAYRGEPPPINHVGLFNPDAYVLMDNMDEHTDTICYQLNREPKSVRDYSEYETFNFEMSLLQKTRFPHITNLIKRMSSTLYKKSRLSSTLDSYPVLHEIDSGYVRLLRNKKFFDQEIVKCETLEHMLRLTNAAQNATKMLENTIKFNESKKLSKIKLYSDVDTYAGIAITVELNHDVHAKIIAEQNKNSYRVKGEQEVFTQEDWEQREKEVLEVSGSLEDGL